MSPLPGPSAPDARGRVWTGGFVQETVGISVQTDASRSLVPLEALVGLALRDNPKRAQLLVSTVLAKHVPTVPGLAVAAGGLLGLLVRAQIEGRPASAGDLDEGALDPAPFSTFGRLLAAPGPPSTDERAELDGLVDVLRRAEADAAHPELVTIGYAETATGLGHLVADALGSPYLHSTRHDVPGAHFTAFEEEHSHASDHRLYPDPARFGTGASWLPAGGTTVLVDDELSTGRTVRNTITALHHDSPQEHWVVASLIDLRSADDRAELDALATELGTRITVVALGVGSITLPPEVLQRARAVIDALPAGSPAAPAADAAAPAPAPAPGEVVVLELDVAPVRSARFGVDGRLDPAFAAEVARRIRSALPGAGTGAGAGADTGTDTDTDTDDSAGAVLVLGSEEFIAVPLTVAAELDRMHGGVRFSTTTRSPIAATDRPDYAIASTIAFTSHDTTLDGPGPRFAYNLTRAGSRFGAIVLFPEPGVDREPLLAPGGAVEALRRVTDRVVVALLPERRPDTSVPVPASAPQHHPHPHALDHPDERITSA